MSAITAFIEKELREFLRSPSSIFWVIGWPVFWQVLTVYVFLAGVPRDQLPQAKESVTIQMVAFGVAFIGISLVGNGIAQDRVRGLYAKLSSMPVRGASEGVGRLLAAAIIALVEGLIIAGVGWALGGRVEVGLGHQLRALPFLLALFLASAGLGLIIPNLLYSVPAAQGVGVAVVVLGSAISGVFEPYFLLPDPLKIFSRAYPLSAAMHAAKYFLIPGEFASPNYRGFNPGTPSYLTYVAASALAIFFLGIAVHGWRARSRALAV